ncbi:MAG TPA: N-6 DNA methylase, partial [Candidatus Binataceae bacterium]|nr:N-6 DNA methylase [Candidatus Binataceae bacterium]
PGHEKVRNHVQSILRYQLGVPVSDLEFELPLPEVHGRADALLGHTVFEFKKDLRREINEAERQLADYLADRERATSQSFIGIATDGAQFIPYELRRGKLVRRTEFKLRKGDIRGLGLWLSPFIAVRPDRKPEPEAVRKELGRESLVYEIAEARLGELWETVRDHPEVAVKRKLWDERLELVYGSMVGDDGLFIQHTYLTIVAKTMATLVLGAEIPAAADLLSGKPFHDAGIEGVIESDFFDWVLNADGAAHLVAQIAAQVGRFKLGDIEHDVLKGLYESLIDPRQRHDLGEYYTPDWLAQWICDRVIDKPLEQRVLDPACGSGTFLFHAVRRLLAAAESAGLPNAEALKRCTENVLGIDVHPVAVINARITYLLAIGEERLRERGQLNIPVYLGDSLQWNTEEIVTAAELRIAVPAKDDALAQHLVFPVRLARNPSLLDATIGEMLRLSADGESENVFRAWIERQETEELAEEQIRRTLAASYGKLSARYASQRNHIWGYVARNLARPVWLSSETERVDVLIGNPPWLSYRYMSAEMQKKFRAESQKCDLWAGGKVATQQDLSAYFFVRTMQLYLRKFGGRKIAFVLPYATMTRKQYRGFIARQENGEKGAVSVPALRFTEAWIFDDKVGGLFNVPSCVLFAETGEATKLPDTAKSFAGQLPVRDASASQALEALTFKIVPWPTAVEPAESVYSKRFRNGATIFPRRLFLVRRTPPGRFGVNPKEPMIESRGSTQEKEPWKSLPPLTGPIEREFLRPLYLGESIAPFRVLLAAEAVIPWRVEKQSANGGRLIDAETARHLGFQHLAKWMANAEALWKKYGAGKTTLSQQLDYYGKLLVQMPPAKLRVVYSASGTLPAACVLSDSRGIIEHGLYWATAQSLGEARYLVGILNSESLRKLVAPDQSRGQWGARHFDKLLANMIPEYSRRNALHDSLAKAAERAEKVAAAVELPESIHFTRARKMIRDALRDSGVSKEIDEFAASLLR